MNIGIIRTSLKKGERRVPIYPEHIPQVPSLLLSQMVFEIGYGHDYGYDDEYFLRYGAAVAERDAILSESDLVVLPKATPEDLYRMKPRSILFGWAHCIQQKAITQAAIEGELTIVAWEAMHHWSATGDKVLHVFYKNNEIAGYSAILHCLELLGIDGHYGPRRKVTMLSYGSVSRGAIYALQGRGFNNIHVLTRRPPHLVADQNPDVYHGQYYYDSDMRLIARTSESEERSLIDELSSADIICNGILQDTNSPIMFVHEEEICKLKPRSLIIDISCDEGMGFTFAKPTSFSRPTFQVGEHITYYSIDHVPTYLWNAASREISKALLPYIGIVAQGRQAWEANQTIERAIEICDGVVKNENIIRFQNRKSEVPYQFR